MSATVRAAPSGLDYPGPRAAAVIARMRAVEGAGPRTGAEEPPLVVESARGATLVDPDGNRFLDLAASFAAANIGHSHPDVVAAVRGQVERVAHVSSAAVSEVRVAFEESLVAMAPTRLDRVLLAMSGADANDLALKLARTLTGRREVLAFSGGYFGRGGGVVGVNGKAAFRTAVGRDPEAHFLPYPHAYRWPLGEALVPADVGAQALALVAHAVEDPASGVGPLAAILVEPVQGNGGVVVPPAGFLAGLRELCDRHGIVLIFDEIQSGFGRTGRLWAGEHSGVTPDLMTVGKGIGGGLAVSAVVGSHRTMGHWAPGTHTSTFMGNAVNLAAGRAALGVMRRERLWLRAASLGDRVLERLRSELAGVAGVGDIRGTGLLIGIELVQHERGHDPDAGRARDVRRAAFRHGVLVGIAGHVDNVVKICPPLTIDESELDEGLVVVVEAIRGGR